MINSEVVQKYIEEALMTQTLFGRFKNFDDFFGEGYINKNKKDS